MGVRQFLDEALYRYCETKIRDGSVRVIQNHDKCRMICCTVGYYGEAPPSAFMLAAEVEIVSGLPYRYRNIDYQLSILVHQLFVQIAFMLLDVWCVVGVFFFLIGRVQSYMVATALSSSFGKSDESNIFQIYGDTRGLKPGRLTNWVCLPQAFSSETISSLQFDVQALKRMGFGSSAGIATKNDTTTRRNVHQIWLQSPAGRPPEYFAGNLDARKEMMAYLDSIRQYLSDDNEPLPRELAELSYLYYEPGASYTRHVDAFADSESRVYRRAISLILFLGDPTNDRTWDPALDGGELRIYSRDTAGRERHHDMTPTPGTLVLFDSSSIPHEVLETHRTRACVVGWFNALQKKVYYPERRL